MFNVFQRLINNQFDLEPVFKWKMHVQSAVSLQWL